MMAEDYLNIFVCMAMYYKLSRINGTLNRVRSFLPQESLMLIYNSLFLPHLNYALLAWGHNSEPISKLQKKAVRLISNAHFLAHTEPLFKNLNLLKMQDLLQLKALKFFYKYSKLQLPAHFDNMFSTQPIDHPHNTRYKDRPRITPPRRSSTEIAVRFYIPKLINEAPLNIVEKIHTHSYQGFSKYVKLTFIKQYSEECTIRDCFICNRN